MKSAVYTRVNSQTVKDHPVLGHPVQAIDCINARIIRHYRGIMASDEWRNSE